MTNVQIYIVGGRKETKTQVYLKAVLLFNPYIPCDLLIYNKKYAFCLYSYSLVRASGSFGITE